VLDGFEREVFGVAVAGLAANSSSIRARMEQRLSCEGYLNYLFARSFSHHEAICVRETPYIDLGADESCSNLGPKAALDLMVMTPDKRRTLLIEAKLVHDCTINAYRDRESYNGGSVYGDIGKMGNLPVGKGRRRLVMVMMVSLSGLEGPEAWLRWLRNVNRNLPDDFWQPLEGKATPLFPVGESGWFHIYLHRLADAEGGGPQAS